MSARRRERAVSIHLIDSHPADGHRALAHRNGVRIPDEEAVKILTVGQAADFVAAHAAEIRS